MDIVNSLLAHDGWFPSISDLSNTFNELHEAPIASKEAQFKILNVYLWMMQQKTFIATKKLTKHLYLTSRFPVFARFMTWGRIISTRFNIRHDVFTTELIEVWLRDS